jgi:hypothetical protein
MTQVSEAEFGRLVDWVEGRLSVAEAQVLAAEVAADARLQAEVAWLRRFGQARAAVRLATPPVAVRAGLVAQFSDYVGTRRPAGLVQRLLALLTFDSGAQLGLAGVRSAATQGQERQLIFSSEAAEVALNILPESGGQGMRLTGQVFPGEGSEGEIYSVQLLREAQEVALTLSDELGEFGFEEVPAGSYELVVSGEMMEVGGPAGARGGGGGGLFK